MDAAEVESVEASGEACADDADAKRVCHFPVICQKVNYRHYRARAAGVKCGNDSRGQQ
jgi:hypothetical protein